MKEAIIFNVQRFSLHDGPGIRTTLFLKGCNLRCYWCHNPESQKMNPQVQHYSHKCKKCGSCISHCPQKILSLSEDRIHIQHELCIGCGYAEAFCPTGALTVTGRSMTVQEAVSLVIRDKLYYNSSKGGVTLSGGEPMLSVDWAVEVFEQLKQENIHTCISTAGNVPFEAFDKVLPLTDLFLFDIKHIDEQRHKEGTGCSNQNILKNLITLDAKGAEIIIRIPVIPEFNAFPEVFSNIAAFIQNNTGIRKIELLPFHKMGESKYNTIGKENMTADIKEPIDDQIESFQQIIREFGFR